MSAFKVGDKVLFEDYSAMRPGTIEAVFVKDRYEISYTNVYGAVTYCTRSSHRVVPMPPTDAERIAQLEARIAELEARGAQLTGALQSILRARTLTAVDGIAEKALKGESDANS